VAGETADADSASGIADIMDTPDVAVWSKEIRRKANMPSDKVREPPKVTSTTLHVEKNESELVDPADKKQVAKALLHNTKLTDESDLA